jgi:transcriptional regulator with XRE-family HTH domain
MNLKEWRTVNKCSMRKLASALGLKSGASILHYENGRIPKPDIIAKIEQITKGKVKVKDFYK